MGPTEVILDLVGGHGPGKSAIKGGVAVKEANRKCWEITAALGFSKPRKCIVQGIDEIRCDLCGVSGGNSAGCYSTQLTPLVGPETVPGVRLSRDTGQAALEQMRL